jgi:hypothetical protein
MVPSIATSGARPRAQQLASIVSQVRCVLGVSHVHVVDVATDPRALSGAPPSAVLLAGNGVAVAWFEFSARMIFHPSLSELLTSWGCICLDVRLAA